MISLPSIGLVPSPVLVVTQPHCCNPQLAIAAVRAGAVGLVHFGCGYDPETWIGAMEKLRRFTQAPDRCGAAWSATCRQDRFPHVLRGLDLQHWSWLLLADIDYRQQDLLAMLRQARQVADRVIVEVYCLSDALAAQEAGFDGLVLKGQESGGRVGEQSSFILLQRVRGKLHAPYWVEGGINPSTAAAVMAAGAAGVVLSEQLWLAEESPLDDGQRSQLQGLDGRETILLGDGKQTYRFFARRGRSTLEAIQRQQQAGQDWFSSLAQAWSSDVAGGRPNPDSLIPAGSAICFAAPLARQFVTVGGILTAFRRSMIENLRLARRQNALAKGSPLAAAIGAAYPIVQGPMSRVSDLAAFGDAVSRHGALPCFALAVSRKPQVERMLDEAKGLLADRRWGVGLLGFAPRSFAPSNSKCSDG